MKIHYYNRAKLSNIILQLIYLEQEMKADPGTDNITLSELKTTINNLRYYLQFLPKTHYND